MKPNPLALEHRLLAALRPFGGGRWLVAVSGGVDSMVMLDILRRWRRGLRVELVVAHVHHGHEHHGESPGFRDRARAHVRAFARAQRLRFMTNRQLPVGLSSEDEYRRYRWRCLRRWTREAGASHVLLAHHRDDLVETQLLRLLRGTGPEGLRAMRVQRGPVLRPMLSASRGEVRAYAEARELAWVEDPSNSGTHALRNWLRNQWLPQLEARQTGATRSLARSLEQLVPRAAGPSWGEHVGLRREALARAPMEQRRQLVVAYVRGLGPARDFGRAHVEEILKRLDGPRKAFSFSVGGVCFYVSPDLVWASRV